MMRPQVALTIARKELLESFRDRKTLFLMIFLPILLYPVLLVVVSSVAMMQQEQLEADRSVAAVAGVDASNPIASALDADEEIDVRFVDGSGLPAPARGDIDVVLDMRRWAEAGADDTAHIDVHFESVDEASRLATDRVERVLTAWADGEVERRLQARGLPPGFAEPLEPDLVDHASTERRGGYLLGSMLPMIVIVTVLIGAYYPAIDLTAGEKERGSIQTLFTAPISTFEIVAGKYAAVVVMALISGMANLLGMILVFGQNLILSEEMSAELDFHISPAAFAALLLAIITLALLLSAVLLTVAVLAQSFKEAQGYITPVYLLCVLPAIVAQFPGFAFEPSVALVPAVGATLWMKEILLDGPRLLPAVLVTTVTIVYTGAVLGLAAKLFDQEEIVAGERATVSMLLRRRRRGSGARPSVGEALVWAGVVFLLFFYIGSYAQSRAPQAGLALSLWGLIAAPTVLFALYLRLDLGETFHLRRPPLGAMLAAVLLGLGTLGVVSPLGDLVNERLLGLSPEVAEAMAREMAGFFPDPDSPLAWAGLLALGALSPALCEEVLFRGFLLSGLRDRVAPWAAVVLTAALFAAFHMNVFRLFGTFVLGALMGVLVLRSGSIVPAMLYHFVSNGLVLTLAGLADGDPERMARFESYAPWAAIPFVAGIALLVSPMVRPSRGGKPGRDGAGVGDPDHSPSSPPSDPAEPR